MAQTHDVYESGLLGLADGAIDWDDAPNVAAVLLDNTYTPNLSTHSSYSDLTGEVTDEDYAPVAIGNRAIDLSAGAVVYTGDDANFGNPVNIAARYLVFVQGDPANLGASNPLISVQDLGLTGEDSMKSSTNSEFRVNMDQYWFRLSKSNGG